MSTLVKNVRAPCTKTWDKETWEWLSEVSMMSMYCFIKEEREAISRFMTKTQDDVWIDRYLSEYLYYKMHER